MIRNLIAATLGLAGGFVAVPLASALAGPPQPAKVHAPHLPAAQPDTPKPAILQKPRDAHAYSG